MAAGLAVRARTMTLTRWSLGLLMGKSLERFLELSQNQDADKSPNSPQNDSGDLSGPNGAFGVVLELDPSADAAERAAIIEYDSAIPRPWAVAFALLLTAPCPPSMTAD